MFLYSRFDIFDRFGVMDLRRFITLKTVVEEGSFLRASQKLCCTQSTVTFHIQQLEQEFSVQLFEKIGRRMCLTREGKKLLPHIYELTRVMDTLREAAKKESDPDGELRVVSGETLLSYRMPQVLQRFRQRAPKVRLSLQSLNCYVIRDALLNDEADVGVFYRVGNDDALNRRELGEQSLVLVASPQIADVDFTEPGRHNACSFIINEPQCVFRQIFESTLRQRRITVENTIELISIESIKRCVAAICDVWLGWPLPLTIIVTLVLGLLLGAWNGWWVAYRKVPSFIVTLAGMLAFRGILIGITNGTTVSPTSAA
eukprot:97200_1